MTFQVGVLRLHGSGYTPYRVNFKDVSGLTKKADVKIAGVKVGWIESLELEPDGLSVQARIMVLKDYVLHTDGQVVIRQEGLLGVKYLEIMPGNPARPSLNPDGRFAGKEPVNLDDLLESFQKIAHNIEQVSTQVSQAFDTNTSSQFKEMLDCIAQTTKVLDRLLVHNETHISGTIQDLKTILHDLKEQIPTLASQLAGCVTQGTDRCLAQVEQSVAGVRQITDKINAGQGLLGKIICDDTAYASVKSTIDSLKSSFNLLKNFGVTLDAHCESMSGLAEKYDFQDSKAYINARIYPSPSYFYLAGLTFSQRGYIHRSIFNYDYFDEKNRPLLPAKLIQDGCIADLVARKEVTKVRQNSFSLNLQVGKVFDNMAFRVGIFESSAGVAFDYCVPFKDSRFKWISTLEIFDLRGRNRLFTDNRPHLKWLNKLFVTPNVYFAFGADDFISKYNKNAFFGAGVRFTESDFKCVMPKVFCN